MLTSWAPGDVVKVLTCAPVNDNIGIVVGPGSSREYPVTVRLSFAMMNFNERELEPARALSPLGRGR